jgi:hypothetical protein
MALLNLLKMLDSNNTNFMIPAITILEP